MEFDSQKSDQEDNSVNVASNPKPYPTNEKEEKMTSLFCEKRFYRMNEIIGDCSKEPIIPISKSTLWSWIAAGKFPQPTKLVRVSVWSGAELNRWINSNERRAA